MKFKIISLSSPFDYCYIKKLYKKEILKNIWFSDINMIKFRSHIFFCTKKCLREFCEEVWGVSGDG
jgi:hypothetical protein